MPEQFTAAFDKVEGTEMLPWLKELRKAKRFGND